MNTHAVHGLLSVLLKTDLDLARGDEAAIEATNAKFSAITTMAQAEAYAAEVVTKASAAEANRAKRPPLRSTVGAPPH